MLSLNRVQQIWHSLSGYENRKNRQSTKHRGYEYCQRQKDIHYVNVFERKSGTIFGKLFKSFKNAVFYFLLRPYEIWYFFR